MKTTTIKCDYCSKEITRGDANTIVDGKGYIFLLTKEPHPTPETSRRDAMFSVKLRNRSDKNLERDICPKCLKHILRSI